MTKVQLKTIPAATVAKLEKLVPLLGSDQDHEVLAAVRAIRKKLEADGFSFHEIVPTMQRGTGGLDWSKVEPRQGPFKKPGPEYRSYTERTDQKQKAWDDIWRKAEEQAAADAFRAKRHREQQEEREAERKSAEAARARAEAMRKARHERKAGPAPDEDQSQDGQPSTFTPLRIKAGEVIDAVNLVLERHADGQFDFIFSNEDSFMKQMRESAEAYGSALKMTPKQIRKFEIICNRFGVRMPTYGY